MNYFSGTAEIKLIYNHVIPFSNKARNVEAEKAERDQELAECRSKQVTSPLDRGKLTPPALLYTCRISKNSH